MEVCLPKADTVHVPDIRGPGSERHMGPIWGFPNSGALFRSPYKTDYSILWSILGPSIFGNSHVCLDVVAIIWVYGPSGLHRALTAVT